MNTPKKSISIMGDSLSTLDGYNPSGYNVFYKNGISAESGVILPSDTWWGQFIERIGGRLLVNNSWSGSRVTKLPYYGKLFPSGCSDERTGGLGGDGVLPDIIVVFMGINDWAYGAPMNASDDYYSFENAYELMLKKLKANYPKADIQCVGIFPVYSLKNGAYELVDTVNGTTYEEVNRIIGRAAKRCRCGFLDSGDFSLAPDETIDGTHPNVKGMKRLADKLINVYE